MDAYCSWIDLEIEFDREVGNSCLFKTLKYDLGRQRAVYLITGVVLLEWTCHFLFLDI